MQESTENVDSHNMVRADGQNQDIAESLEESADAQNAELEELNKKINNWNISLNIKQEEELKRRETSVKNLIGYEWKEASNGDKIEVVNPATSELIDTVPNVTEEDVDEAVKVAMVEQKKWAEVPIHERADKLYKFVDLVEENKERLARASNRRNRKTYKRSKRRNCKC